MKSIPMILVAIFYASFENLQKAAGNGLASPPDIALYWLWTIFLWRTQVFCFWRCRM